MTVVDIWHNSLQDSNTTNYRCRKCRTESSVLGLPWNFVIDLYLAKTLGCILTAVSEALKLGTGHKGKSCPACPEKEHSAVWQIKWLTCQGNLCFCCSERLECRKGEVWAMAELLLPLPNRDSFNPVKIKTKAHSPLNLQCSFWINENLFIIIKVRISWNAHVSPIHIIATWA